MANINSLSENTERLTANVNDAMSALNAINESMFSDSDSVTVDGVTVPSYSSVITRLQRAENTVSAFVKGNGVVQTDDSTYRRVKVTTVPKAPAKIENIETPVSFVTDSNWIFEDLMFPKCKVQIDLKGKIDDDADRVIVNRVILSTEYTDFYTQNILGRGLSYPDLITLLNGSGISYSEDYDTVDLPIGYERFAGSFTIQSAEAVGDGGTDLWYYLDTVMYNAIDRNGNVTGNDYALSKGSLIRYADSLFKIKDIDKDLSRIRIEYNTGYDQPAVGGAFHYYNAPFETKTVEVGFGFDEIDTVYFKAINDDYNIVSHEWSDPISFITNELTLDGGDMTFAEYYRRYVTDLGAKWMDDAKSNTVLATAAITPNAPVINVDDLEVVQINKQLEATFNSKEYNSLVREVESTRSEVNSLNTNISGYKNQLVTETSETNITTLKNLIDSDTAKLQNATQRYESAVTDLNTLLNKSGAISYSPKYHIRGFFQIPDAQYADSANGLGRQEVIGFDIMYRYLHTNDSGVSLDTFTYTKTAADGTTETAKAVFSDWNMVTSLTREQVWDDETGTYIWKDEQSADGDVININQIDIPIRYGEKVEIKARSISEAGYPRNPAKSR